MLCSQVMVRFLSVWLMVKICSDWFEKFWFLFFGVVVNLNCKVCL